MGKITRRKKDGVNIVSGRISKIADDRLSMSIKVRDYSDAEKKWQDDEINVSVLTPLGAEYAPGEPATGIGYQNGAKSIMAQTTMTKDNAVFNMESLCVVSGMVRRAVFKPELNEDGTPILKRRTQADIDAGRPAQPRKPHFDISIDVMEPTDGDRPRKVTHIIKVYDLNNTEDDKKPSNIEKMKNYFKDFEDADSTPTFVTIGTQIGEVRSWDNTYNDKTYTNYCCDHMGVNFIDVEKCYVKERTQDTPQAQQQAPATPAPAATAPTPAPAAQNVHGQPADPSFEEVSDEELPFE